MSAQETISSSRMTAEEIWQRGKTLYDRELKSKLEATHTGQFVVVNVANGAYFVDTDEDRALDLAEEQFPDEVFYIGRIGSDTVDRLGSLAKQ